jgi:N-acetylglutamate synthase/N-acetylornithine aminotransferase
MQRLALALGWRTWGVGVENEEFDEIKAEAKEKRKEEGIIKAKKTREENKLKELLRYNNLSPTERAAEDAEKARKRSEAAKKGAETRKRNKRIKDSIQTADLIKLLQQ